MDDLRVGRILRALRHRLGWRQIDVAEAAGLTQDDVSRGERGKMRDVEKLRRHGRVFDAEIQLSIWWRAGEIDRLLDEGHASIVAWVVKLLGDLGWEVHPEVTFAVRGERGSVDVLAWHAPSRTLLVVEVKTELKSLEETLRRHDAKQRLAATIAAERFGWPSPASVNRLLVLPDRSTPRRHVKRHAAVLDTAYRVRGNAARQWLRSPDGPVSLLVFAPVTRGTRGKRGSVSRRRIRRAHPSVRSTPSNATYAPDA